MNVMEPGGSGVADCYTGIKKVIPAVEGDKEREKSIVPAKHSKANIVCKHWRKGFCSFEECIFRHSEPDDKEPEEAAVPVKPSKSNVVCKHWQKGFCAFEECNFRHSKPDDKEPEEAAVPVKPLKSNVVCKHWRKGFCALEECNFRHSEQGTKEAVTVPAVGGIKEVVVPAVGGTKEVIVPAVDGTKKAIVPVVDGTKEPEEATVLAKPAKPNVCRHWRKGFCSFDDECIFRHSEPEETVERVVAVSNIHTVDRRSLTASEGSLGSLTASIPSKTSQRLHKRGKRTGKHRKERKKRKAEAALARAKLAALKMIEATQQEMYGETCGPTASVNAPLGNAHGAYANNSQSATNLNAQNVAAGTAQSAYASNSQKVTDLPQESEPSAADRKPCKYTTQPPPPGTEPVELPPPPSTEPVELPAPPGTEPVELPAPLSTQPEELRASPGTKPGELPAAPQLATKPVVPGGPPGNRPIEIGIELAPVQLQEPGPSMSSGFGKRKKSRSGNKRSKGHPGMYGGTRGTMSGFKTVPTNSTHNTSNFNTQSTYPKLNEQQNMAAINAQSLYASNFLGMTGLHSQDVDPRNAENFSRYGMTVDAAVQHKQQQMHGYSPHQEDDQKGYLGMFGAAHVASSGINQGTASRTNDTENVPDQLAKLKEKIMGFAKKPTPKPLVEQSMTGQKVDQPFKVDHFSPSMKQVVTEHDLSGSEQAELPSMNTLGTSIDQRYSGQTLVQDNFEQRKFEKVVDYNHKKSGLEPTEKELGSYKDPIAPGSHSLGELLMKLVEYGKSVDCNQQNQQLIQGHDKTLMQDQTLLYGNDGPLKQNQREIHGYGNLIQQDQQLLYGNDDHLKQNQQEIHGYGNFIQQDQHLMHGSPERKGRFPDTLERSSERPKRFRMSPESFRISPERLSREQTKFERSLEGLQRSCEGNRLSPERHRKSPERSPENQRQASEMLKKPTEEIRRSYERYGQSPERSTQSTSKQHDIMQSRRDRSPIWDNSKWSKEDKYPETNAPEPSETLDISIYRPGNTRNQFNSHIKNTGKHCQGENFKPEFESRKHSFKTEISVFQKPFVPPPGTKSFKSSSKTSVTKTSKFSQAYTQMPPHKVYNPLHQSHDESDREIIKTNKSKRHQSKNSTRQNKECKELDYDDESFIAMQTPEVFQDSINDPREPVLGHEISDFIANFITTVGKSKQGVQIVAKKYRLPGNCIGLIPPKMTHDVWDILKKPTQMRDETLQDVQRWLSVGIIPVIEQIDLFGAGVQGAKDVCRVTSDSLTVLSYVLLNMSIKRRLIMRNSLNKKYGVLCQTSNKVTEFLFGDSLAKGLREIKSGMYQKERSREEDNDDMLSPNYKPTFFPGLAVPGADVDDNMASMVNMACANEGEFTDLREKYKIPGNCDILIPAKINPEMWSLLSRSGLELDYRLQDVQLSIAEGTVPLMRLLQSVHEKSYDPCEALGMLTDSLGFFGNAVYQMNKVRMEAMLKTLPKTVHDCVHWCWPGAQQVT